MEEKYTEATNNRPDGDRILDAPFLKVDIASLLKQLRKEKAWEESDRNAITVFKSDKFSIILVVLHKKAEMTTEKPQSVLSLQLLNGRIKFHTAAETVTVKEGELCTLHADVTYKIEALKKSFFLLTVAQ